MKRLKALFHPIFVFVVVQVAWIGLMAVWIYWYFKNSQNLAEFAKKLPPELLESDFNWVVLLEGGVLMLMILAGVYVIFVYWNKQSRLYQLQSNFVSSVSHELKSPLASIRLYLETLKYQKVSSEEAQDFVEIMLSDTERLSDLIDNILESSKSDPKSMQLQFTLVDIVLFLQETIDHHKKLFEDKWVVIGVASSLPNVGDSKPFDLLGIPLLIVRNKKNKIKVFHNICSHRGSKLVTGASKKKNFIRCPYHSWSYNLDGDLIATPHIGGMNKHESPGFKKSNSNLKEVKSSVWLDLIMININNNEMSFEKYIKPLNDRWSKFWPTEDRKLIRHSNDFGYFKLEAKCNWKFAIENYCESYHLPWVHPSLNAYSKIEDHLIMLVEITIQTIAIYALTGIFAGLMGGMLGLGGGIIIVPVLHYIFTQQGFASSVVMHQAVTTSLATIIITSLFATYTHHQKKAV